MKTKNCFFRLSLFIFFFILAICLDLPNAYAQDKPNTITFDNKSGEYAMVKLIGSTIDSIEVPNKQNRTLNVAAGKYHILVRYGIDSSNYNYSKGDPFEVEQTETQYSILTIILEKVINGNYFTSPSSREEFEKSSVKNR
jgi:hypothetical protein